MEGKQKKSKSNLTELREKKAELEKKMQELVVSSQYVAAQAIELFKDPSLRKEFIDLSRRKQAVKKNIRQHASDSAGKILDSKVQKRLNELTVSFCRTNNKYKVGFKSSRRRNICPKTFSC